MGEGGACRIRVARGGCGRVRYRCAVRRGSAGGTAGKERRGKWRRMRRGTAGARGVGAGAVPCCLHRTKSKAAVRQPCSLSTFDSLKPMQSGFFGSRGLLGRKVLEWGMGRSPIKIRTNVGVRGAQPREIVPPAGREAPRIYSYFTTTVSSPSRRAKYSSSPTVAPYTSDE